MISESKLDDEELAHARRNRIDATAARPKNPSEAVPGVKRRRAIAISDDDDDDDVEDDVFSQETLQPTPTKPPPTKVAPPARARVQPAPPAKVAAAARSAPLHDIPVGTVVEARFGFSREWYPARVEERTVAPNGQAKYTLEWLEEEGSFTPNVPATKVRLPVNE